MSALEQFSFLFSQDGGYLRIPIWGHIPLSLAARRIIEHPDFVRLQRIRQLGWVYYVFPGASHTRFEHSIGAYHLSVLMLQRLVLNPANWDGDVPKITPEEARVFLAASLLHDIGHYPFAHLVDRLPGFQVIGSHRCPSDIGCACSHSDRNRARARDELIAAIVDEISLMRRRQEDAVCRQRAAVTNDCGVHFARPNWAAQAGNRWAGDLDSQKGLRNR